MRLSPDLWQLPESLCCVWMQAPVCHPRKYLICSLWVGSYCLHVACTCVRWPHTLQLVRRHISSQFVTCSHTSIRSTNVLRWCAVVTGDDNNRILVKALEMQRWDVEFDPQQGGFMDNLTTRLVSHPSPQKDDIFSTCTKPAPSSPLQFCRFVRQSNL